MDVKTTYSGVNSGRGPSFSIWGDCPLLDIDTDPNIGYGFFDDFMSIPKTAPTTEGNFGQYRAFTSTGGAIVDGGSLGGSVKISSDGDDEGASIATNIFPFNLVTAGGKMWFETRIKVSSIADTISDVFVGLVDSTALTATVPITATTPVMADINFIGFQRLGTDGDKLDIKYKADGQTVQTLLADAVTLVADTYIKVGWKFDPDAATANRIKFYYDGTLITTYGTGANMDAVTFPDDVNMGLCFATLNAAGSITPTATMDWWRCYQLAV